MKSRLGALSQPTDEGDQAAARGGFFTKETLRSLLENNDLGAYDPVAEAFKAFDPNGTGYRTWTR